MRDQVERDAINARRSGLLSARQNRQLAVITARQISTHIFDLTLQQKRVVEQPFAGNRNALLQRGGAFNQRVSLFEYSLAFAEARQQGFAAATLE